MEHYNAHSWCGQPLRVFIIGPYCPGLLFPSQKIPAIRPEGVIVYLVLDRSCSLIRWIHSSSSGARYDARYSSRSLLKKVGDSPAVALLPSGNRGNKGLIHILVWKQ